MKLFNCVSYKKQRKCCARTNESKMTKTTVKSQKFSILNFNDLMVTWFGLGKLPLAPGTWGSIGALPMCWFLAQMPSNLLRISFIVGFLAFSILMCAQQQSQSKDRDPQHIVIDEVIGMMIAIPYYSHPAELIIGFILFRAFDVLKPFPIYYLDRASKTSNSIFFRGAYIVLDDVGAGIYAFLVLRLILHFAKSSL